MIDADADVALIQAHVVDAVGDRFTELLVLEVVDTHELGLALRSPFPPLVLEVADELLLLGIHADHRPARRDRCLGGLIDVRKLSVAVG